MNKKNSRAEHETECLNKYDYIYQITKMFSELRIQDTGDTKYKMVWILHEPRVSFLEYTKSNMHTHRYAKILEHNVHIIIRKSLIHLHVNNKMNQTTVLDLNELL